MDKQNSPSSTVLAADFLDPEGTVVGSAERVSRQVIQTYRTARALRIDLTGMPATSSTYFNVVFRQLAEAFGPQALDYIEVVGTSPLMIEMIGRSRDAIRRLCLQPVGE